jgi:hypothetical protein
VDGELSMYGHAADSGCCHARILDIQTLRQEDPFGHVHGGQILIQGHMCKLELTGLKRNPKIDELMSRMGFDMDIYPLVCPSRFLL